MPTFPQLESAVSSRGAPLESRAGEPTGYLLKSARHFEIRHPVQLRPLSLNLAVSGNQAYRKRPSCASSERCSGLVKRKCGMLWKNGNLGSVAEREALVRWYRCGVSQRGRQRAQAILLSARGYRVAALAAWFKVARDTVSF